MSLCRVLEVREMAEPRVLIVDDEPEFLEALAERLRMRGLRVETARSGLEALNKAAEGTYDAVILDLVMPGLDGIETLKHLKAERPDFQVILLTGHATLPKGVESMKLGALDFLEKPADLETLLAKVKEARARRLMLVRKDQEEKLREILSRKGW